jgi:hypothetical protein
VQFQFAPGFPAIVRERGSMHEHFGYIIGTRCAAQASAN